MSSIFEKLFSVIDPKLNKSEYPKPNDHLTRSRQGYKSAMAKALLPIALVTSSASCTLDTEGLGLGETMPDAGVGGEAGAGGSAGEGGVAGQGGSAGEAGNGGEAGAGGCVPTEEICDGNDNNCNNETDENLVAPLCGKTVGVCETPAQYPDCDGENGWTECEYNSDYEDGTETKCDGLDNDCDGDTDEMTDLAGQQPACAEDNEGVCQGATAARTCESGEWSDCEYGSDYEPTNELSCDGLDNDCDGTADERCVTTLSAPGYYEQLINEDDTAFNARPGSTGNQTCENTDTEFMTKAGNIQVVWRFGGDSESDIKIVSSHAPVGVQAGCSIHATTDCPTNQEMWNDFMDVTKDTNLTINVNGDEYTYTHNGSCLRHTFFIEW